MEIPKGKLIPIGGNEVRKRDENEDQISDLTDTVLKEIITEINSPNPLIEVLPIASKLQKEMEKKYREVFSRLGLEVGVILVDDKSALDNGDVIQRINRADCVFITGGDQSRLKNMLAGTMLLNVLKERYTNEDFILAGTSAGAMIMSEYMIDTGESEEALRKGNINLSEGLEFLPGTIIDTHFMQRGRISRLTEALLMRSDCTGIGICEDTALVITKGDEIRALGSGSVTIIETYDMGITNYDYVGNHDTVFVENLIMHILARGSSYSLKEKKLISLEEKVTAGSVT
jgi:cyanophycinase